MPQCSASHLADSFIAVMLQDLEQTENEQRFIDGKPEIEINREDIDADALQQIVRDCQAFYIANENHVHASGACVRDGCDDQAGFAGSDLYMTRAGHGVGFWDSTCWKPEHGQPMSDYVDGMGYFEPYIGDDGKVYL